MTAYYYDTSALVKRYADESGSTWVRQITYPASQHTILLAEITLAELAAALSAKHRAPKGMTREQRDHVLSRFLQDCAENYVLLQVDRAVIDRAVELTQNHRLRGYDAVPGLTLSWVNKLGSEDSGAPPADSPGTSSRVVRTSFASIPGLSL